ncbi:MAG: DUF433 domain-containing protein [Thermoanaerobaculia bacterium]
MAQAAEYLGLSETTLRQWVLGRPYPVKAGSDFSEPLIRLPEPGRPLLSFTNLVEAYVLASLRRKHQIKMGKIRLALSYLEDELGSEHPLATEQLESAGGSLFLKKYGQLIDLPESGQIAIEEVLKPYLKRIDHDKAGLAVRLFPVRRSADAFSPKVVVIDPEIAFGRPTVAGRGVSVAILVDRFRAGESMADLAEDYDLNPQQVEEAILYGLPDELAA